MSVFDPVALALFSAALFGVALVVTQFGLRHLHAATGALVSIPSTMLLFWLAAPFALKSEGWNLAALGVFAAVGLFYPALVTLLTFESNRRIGPTATATVANTTPLFAVAGAMFFLGEQLTLRIVAGTVFIVTGVMALSRDGSQRARWTPWIIALPLAAAAIRAGAHVLAKLGLTLWADPFAAGLIGYTVSGAVVWVTVGVANRGSALAFARKGVAWFALVGLCNGSALLLMYFALTHAPVTTVSPLVSTYPLFTLLLSAIWLREERLSRRVLAGVAVSVAGVILLIVR